MRNSNPNWIDKDGVSMHTKATLISHGLIPISAPKCTKRRDMAIIICIAAFLIGAMCQ